MSEPLFPIEIRRKLIDDFERMMKIMEDYDSKEIRFIMKSLKNWAEMREACGVGCDE